MGLIRRTWWVLALAGCTGLIADPSSEDTVPSARGATTEQCAELAPQVGETPVRRLTQTQYRFTATDVLGFDAISSSAERVLSTITDRTLGRFHASGPMPDVEVSRAYLELAEELAAAALDAGVGCEPSSECASDVLSTIGRRAFDLWTTVCHLMGARDVETVGEARFNREPLALG
jgi:hypothetical protein